MPYKDKELSVCITRWQRKFNCEKFRATRRVWSRDYRARNKETCDGHSRAWISRNRDHVRKRDQKRYQRRKLLPAFRLYRAVRDRVRCATRNCGVRKRERGIRLLGCSAVFYRRYLERLFLPGMTWANRHLWHIDHETPICKFDLSTLAGQQAAFHYTNTQPLWAVDNLRKGAKLPDLTHV